MRWLRRRPFEWSRPVPTAGRTATRAATGGLAVLVALLATGCSESDRSAGVVQGPGRSAAELERRDAARRPPGRAQAGTPVRPRPRQILFGDLHVHSTFSIDAFLYALPIFGGEGVHPPADACDYARWCADLDFFSINDHAEGLTPERWAETRESIRACNERAGDPANPDLVAYLGWEWTQVGATPESHFGHKNVILREQADDRVPARPITSLPDGTTDRARAMWLVSALQALGPLGLADYAHFLWMLQRIVETPDCPRGVDVRALPVDCRENAETPEELFEKLAQWGFDTLVIPHGLAWGVHAPPGARMEVQLAPGRHDPETQRLIEIHSGHGNSEEFRRFAEFELSPDGERVCPEPTADYLPCCWRAGEIVRERCGEIPEAECEERVRDARRLALEAGTDPHLVLPDTRTEDWLDCDQCRDCFKPAMSLRPGMTAQYATALSDPDAPGDDGRPSRFRLGFIASSDNHSGRPGTGFKQVGRKGVTDARGVASARLDGWLRPFVRGRQQDPERAQARPPEERGFRSLLDMERSASFMYPGGLVAVHSTGRDRDAVWDALVRREVYGTSGPRILLWFDLLEEAAPDGGARASGPVPMGGQALRRRASEGGSPLRFEVRAVGAFRQRPGCPEASVAALAPERLERLCGGECYHPSDERHPIETIEVIRIRPQRDRDEPVADLIEDPWRRFECEPDPAGCTIRFEDAGFERDSVYYVRALQAATPAINGRNVRASFDEAGRAVGVEPCFGGWRTAAEDECLSPVRERAWSSPIFVDARSASEAGSS